MGKVVQLSLLEMKKISIRPYIYLTALLASLASIAMGVEVMYGQNFSMTHIFMFFSMIAEWVIIYYGSKVLGEEFSVKTSTLIFTKAVSRKKIIFSKIMSLIGLGAIFGTLSSVIAIVFQYLISHQVTTEFLIREALYNVLAYILFAVLMGSFGTLAALITMNATSSLLITLLSFQFAPALLNLAGEKFAWLHGLLDYIPFYSAITFVEQHQLAEKQLIGIAIGIIIFTISSLVIVDRKDLV